MSILTHIVASLSGVSPKALPNPTGVGNGDITKTIQQIVFGIIGALALLMIVLSGFRYITSAGNPDKATKAREGIIYALVGLAVAITAEAIVAFVVSRL